MLVQNEWFVAIDGDDIGRRLELCMLRNDADSLKAFAAEFSEAVDALMLSLSLLENVEIILSGGDSILIRLRGDSVDDVLGLIRNVAAGRDFTFSGGYGPTMRSAYIALKLAKSLGKDRIEGPLLTGGGQ